MVRRQNDVNIASAADKTLHWKRFHKFRASFETTPPTQRKTWKIKYWAKRTSISQDTYCLHGLLQHIISILPVYCRIYCLKDVKFATTSKINLMLNIHNGNWMMCCSCSFLPNFNLCTSPHALQHQIAFNLFTSRIIYTIWLMFSAMDW